MEKKKIIIDTDIGDDIDDLFVLYLLPNSSEVEVLGITTVFRNAAARARMAKYALGQLGREEIPVYAGADNPLLCIPEQIVGELREKEAHDRSGKYLPPQYADYMDAAKVESDHAVNFIISQAKRYGKDLHLLFIGALTNAALAIRLAPDIMKGIGGITLMGGYFYQDFTEWNIMCDPEAAQIVFSSGIPVRAVGIDVTSKCVLDQSFQNKLRETGVKADRLFPEMLGKWFEHYRFSAPVMHDPLAFSSPTGSGFVDFRMEKVRVGLAGGERAKTIICEEGHPIQVAYQVNTEAFFRFFKKRLFVK